MNFEPYHKFSACRKLEERIVALNDAGAVPAALYAEHERYHFSLLHKLRSARYHVDTLSSFLRSGTAQSMAPIDLVYRVNFHFDGFLHVVGSATDIFAREVLTYFGIPLPNRVYYKTAEEQLTIHRSGDAFITRLQAPSWKQEFSNYRNTSTHERLIGTQYSISVQTQGHSFTQRVVVPVPDDPRSAVPTFENNPDIVDYCCKTFKRVVSHFNQAYSDLDSRVKSAGCLPL